MSIDPKRVYVTDPSQAPGKVVMPLIGGELGPNGERYCWWQATVKGGREARDLCAVALAKGCEALGAGEVMLNCIDKDGQGQVTYAHIHLHIVNIYSMIIHVLSLCCRGMTVN